MTNQLHQEKSTYLLERANQPVDWMTWSSDALQKAQSENKPLLISIGYSACHWCQTMSRENFEDSYVASLMNRHFVCILIDREERPDLDQVFMEAVQMFNQSPGWPLNVFCLPTGEPFWGGTFFPKEDRGEGIAPWPQVLIRISEHFRKHPEELAENAQNVMKNLEHSNNSECSGSSPWNNELLVTAIKKFHELHDNLYGGFTRAPKFPPSMKIDFLLGTLESEYAKQRPEVQAGNENCITKTLESMATGGIFDQLDGGFFRYSIDEKWSVPHFEKMLIENSLLISTYSKAFRKFKNPLYAKVIRKTLDWVFREMGNEKLGFSSSSSAESENAHGKYYLWKETELVEVLGQNNAKMFIKDLDKLSLGDSNFFLPRLRESEEENEILEKRLFPLLREVRVLRTHPKKDEKRVLSFNASMIGALVEASIALNEIELLNRACELANWLNENFLIKEKMFSVLYLNEEEVRKMHSPSLDDLVFWAENLLILASKSEMVHLGSSESYLKDATVIMDTVKDQYKDQRNPGFFTSSNRAIHPPPLRKKVWFDNSTPSGNSSLLRVFSMLFAFTKDKKWHSEYLKAKSAYPNLAKKNPEGIAYAITCILEEAMGIVTITIPKEKMADLGPALSQKPHRPIIVKATSSKECELVVGKNNFRTKTVRDALDLLFS